MYENRYEADQDASAYHQAKIDEYEYWIKEQEEEAYAKLCSDIREIVSLVESTILCLHGVAQDRNGIT